MPVEPQERHGARGAHERVGGHAVIGKRQGGDEAVVGDGDQDRPAQRGRCFHRGQVGERAGVAGIGGAK